MASTPDTPRTLARQITQDCVARRLRQLSRIVTRQYDEALRPIGLTVNQLNILALVVSQGQLRPGQLGAQLGMEKSTVSRTVARMESRGWIDIGAGTDRRSQALKATYAGRQLLLQAAPLWQELQNRLLDPTSDSGSLLAAFGMLGHQGDSHQPFQTERENTDSHFYSGDSAEDFYS